MDEKQTDKIVLVNIEDEMKKSYIDYAMSVIVARALPDVRDGLKPVHRRILHTMNEMHLDPNKSYKKSARIVGDTMGKYHPHGDSSIYDAMVRMAQNFSMRYMLVDGQGNFGSLDGDSAAAHRYTEARLSKISTELLSDIEKDTVDFKPNYNEEFLEPVVLPAKYPNLLVNGSSGIAVGMATNIPPHNLREIIDGVVQIIDNHVNEQRETEIEELVKIVKGPDLPTGATILGTAGIKQAYRTGRGKFCVRSKVEIETMSSGREMLVVSEIPYQVNKARLVEKIADLVKEKRVEGISDLRDESDRKGIRIVIELKKEVNANVILNQLYKYSQLQENFSIQMLALTNGQPKIFNLKEVLEHYLTHQKEVIARRTQFELNKALKRSHLLEGFRIALDNIDELINILRSSKDTAIARQRIIERFGFSDEQAQAIMDMRFRSLTGLERDKIEAEYLELQEQIKYLQGILADESRLYAVIKEELLIIKTKYGDERRTEIVFDTGEIDLEDLIDEEINVITMTHFDYIKRLQLNTYKSQNRGGRGILGMQTRQEDLVKNLIVANTHDNLLFFTNTGKVFRIKAYEIPEAGRTAKGTAIVNLLDISSDEKITAVIPLKDMSTEGYLMMVTKRGVVKKTPLESFANIRTKGLIAVSLREDDELISVAMTDGTKELFIATKNGMGIRFHEEGIRPMGRKSSGVRGIRLRGEDIVVGTEVLEEGYKILLVSQRGFGKCTEYDEFTLRSRGGIGLKAYKVTEKTGEIIGVTLVNDKEELMIINSEGVIIRIRVNDISTISRVTQGVKLIQLPQSVNVVSIAKISEDYIEESDNEEEEAASEDNDDGTEA